MIVEMLIDRRHASNRLTLSYQFSSSGERLIKQGLGSLDALDMVYVKLNLGLFKVLCFPGNYQYLVSYRWNRTPQK